MMPKEVNRWPLTTSVVIKERYKKAIVIINNRLVLIVLISIVSFV
jgi:hypothetical protein